MPNPVTTEIEAIRDEYEAEELRTRSSRQKAREHYTQQAMYAELLAALEKIAAMDPLQDRLTTYELSYMDAFDEVQEIAQAAIDKVRP